MKQATGNVLAVAVQVFVFQFFLCAVLFSLRSELLRLQAEMPCAKTDQACEFSGMKVPAGTEKIFPGVCS